MTMDTHFRPLDTDEREIIERLLESEFPGRDELREQLKAVTARKVDDEGSLEFRVIESKPAPVKYRIPTEAVCPDTDGVNTYLLLHVVGGMMAELEIFKEDKSHIRRRPTADCLVITPCESL